MTVERGLRLIAGLVVLAGVGLSVMVSTWWLLLVAFAGLNLFQSGLTNWCPMVWLLQQLGLARCVPEDIVSRETEAPCITPGGMSLSSPRRC